MIDLKGMRCLECGHPVGVDPDDPAHLKGSGAIHLRCDEETVTAATIGADRAFSQKLRNKLREEHLYKGHPQVTRGCYCCASEVDLWIMRVRGDIFGFARLAISNDTTRPQVAAHLARKTDPETSRSAAERIVRSGTQKSIKERVLAALVASPDGLTYSEVAVTAGVKDAQAWRRLSDLKNEGKVVANGTRVINGYEQTVWAVKPGQSRLF